MIASLLSIKICVHEIDNSNNEIRGSGIKWDTGRNEKQLIKFAWPYGMGTKKLWEISTMHETVHYMCLQIQQLRSAYMQHYH